MEPIALPWTGMYGALQSDLVDGGDNPANVIRSSGFYTMEKYLTCPGCITTWAAPCWSTRISFEICPRTCAG